ncbi:MAG: cytochrome c biogenesis protein CcsA [Flavobacteriaceae bacterium]|nr:cytochrome c biogenesis protein CcsA [Flavobacteriaceae bacterium]
MQKKLASILFSTRLTAVLFIVFAVAMAIGTFLDRAAETSPTPYSREMIYNTLWFEAIMVFFVINFVGNIFRFRLYKKKKWATLTLHLSFILILIGAFVTRYIGYEGLMPIREGATESSFLSTETYLKTFIDGDYKVDGVAQRRNLALEELDLSERLNNDFTINTDYNKQPLTIKYKDFVSNVKEGFIASEDGDEYLKIVESGSGQGHDHWLKRGEVANLHNVLIALDKPTVGAINISIGEDAYNIEAPFDGFYMNMSEVRAAGIDPTEVRGSDVQEIMTRFRNSFVKDSVQNLALRALYSMGGMQFVIPEPVAKGRYGPVKVALPEKTNQDVLVLELNSMGETQTVELLGGKFMTTDPVRVDIAGLKVYLSYGAKELELPFSITLNDFIADKYPGTDRGYSAYRSKLTVNTSDTDFYDYDVYMNNILDHGGFRFFQASFDPDEKGTVLSVNHDFWGTWITYIGYFLLYFGLLAILFDRNTRFADLKRMLNKVKDKKAKLITIIVLLFSFSGIAQETSHARRATLDQIDSIVVANTIDKVHAERFGRLVVQDNGRMKPINTFASEILRKISGEDKFGDLNANQVFLSMTEIPQLWFEVPIMKLDWKNDSIKRIIGVPKDVSEAAIVDLLDGQMRNKLGPYLVEATSKANPNQFEKDFIKLNEKTYILDQALSGGLLKLFPIPGDQNNKWISRPELGSANIKGQDSVFVSEILSAYRLALDYAKRTNDYTEADKALDLIIDYQKKYGSDVLPSEKKVGIEIAYNKANLFNRLYHYFALFGFLMFTFVIVQIFVEKKWLVFAIKTLKVGVWMLFASMIGGLVARWYISGHAPWSDAYESVIYVSTATVFFGLVFGRKSDLTVASTAFVAAMLLWVAHLNWLDPAIANIQPVLDSYWLMIHVAVIVASYGPFALGWILGATTMLLMIFTTKKNKAKMDLNIKELTIIIEMVLTVGLVMLAIGNFLGGQWANESWGRYWGWDPKETWALISIMIYAFVIHMRLVPGLRGRWFFSVMAVFAFASIMMTYFGVNFYLTGLHSYASGDVPVTPSFVFYLFGTMLLLSVLSYFQYKKHYVKKG